MSRRIRVILFIDVTDSTMLLASDATGKEGSLANVMRRIQIDLRRRSGQEFSSAGDGVGYFFNDVRSAVHAACDVLRDVANIHPPVRVRAGLHVGEVTKINSSYYGIALNLAARVQTAAKPGSLYATAAAAQELQHAPEFETSSLGEFELRGISEKVRLFSIERKAQRRHSQGHERTTGSAAIETQGSIAVLPFDVQSDVERWKYFGAGFTEDLTGNLARFRTLTVIAPHSSFEAAKQHQPAQELAFKLKANYVVHGRIQVFDDRMRISAGLMDATRGTQVWSEKFDRPTSDLFIVMDDISGHLASHLATRVEQVEKQRIRRSHPGSLESYELLLRGLELYLQHQRPTNKRARDCFRLAIRMDPGFARAYAALSKTYNLEWRYRWSKDSSRSIGMALELAKIAVEMDRLDARGHAELGFAHLYRRELDESLSAYEEALDLNPNDADIIAEYGDALIYDGEPARCIGLVDKAIRLNPSHPDWYLWVQGGAYHQLQKYEQAIATLKRMKDATEASRLLAASYARLGAKDEALRWALLVRQKHPTFSIEDWATTQPFRNPADLEHFVEGMALAGLPA
ncbi:adenylate/guanylate cyclase domain-containing protein [Microvirga yunnanensis]|uniref:adenylate/guanylate cyclase domain-containing protein n=1 Tax=Microvirga yunnanensis TaxID=2953740 RepID=UPI0021C869D2|nr:adenylate/guanylate cyclase domain-containing protein [Microvirga sp. HBU65207]